MKYLFPVVMLLGAWSANLAAQSIETRMVLSDYGWHGVGDGVEVHKPTLEAQLPWVGLWERTAVGHVYGQWLHVKLLINCEQWSQIPFATLDQNGDYQLIENVIGDKPRAVWPDPGTEPYRTMTAVCGLYGYERPQPRNYAPDPGNYVERKR